MSKKDSPTITTAETSSIMSSPDPETNPPRRKSSITNPFKSLRDFKAGEHHKLPTASANPNAFSPPAAGTGADQDDFVGMMHATKGMTPEEVKSYLESKEKRDGESYGKDVSQGSPAKGVADEESSRMSKWLTFTWQGSVGGLYWNRQTGNQQT